ncbi:MAG TPA: thioesterase family protein [Bryobacteraceae bacterium]|nr:thioesterase family protein [Bryobacteraceae bacterium]
METSVFHEARVRVRYAETDQMGVVYYANYLVWMEVGRVEYCKAVGFNYRDMEREDGVLLAVAEAQCRYVFPARYDDEVVVKTWVERASRRLVAFGYEMRRAQDDRVLARGESTHIFCGVDMRPARLPEKYGPMFGIGER